MENDKAGTPLSLVETTYAKYETATNTLRKRLGRDSLTFAEKVLAAHSDDIETVGLNRGEDYADYRPDRVAMQDATAQMALLQFMTAGLDKVAVPTTVHCDHLILARKGASIDLGVSIENNEEVFDFL
ncbi:MAG TPA: aconitase family protein, partial [Acidimicrobiia bacterium]|nr:aconitase family protein [Acidimicrobiia bacterium]